MSATEAGILADLPHGPSFRFVSEIVERRPGDYIVAVWRVDGSEAFFSDHFPGDPIVPGVLLTEALAQAAGLVVGQEFGECPAGPGGLRSGALLCHIDVRLRRPVRPPAVITLEARLNRAVEGLYLFDVAARVDATPVASGRLTLGRRDRAEGAEGGARA